MQQDENRIYAKKVDLCSDNIKEFYDKRAAQYKEGIKNKYTTVLLGDNHPEYAQAWNDFEKSKILPFLSVTKESSILDIGCGIGRWAETLIPLCGEYAGTDFSGRMIETARERFHNSGNCKFVNCSFQEIFTNTQINKNQ